MRWGRPLSVGTPTGAGSPDRTSTRSASIRALMTKALPVCRWQSRQWQQCTNIGADRIRKRTDPQAHPPSKLSDIVPPWLFRTGSGEPRQVPRASNAKVGTGFAWKDAGNQKPEALDVNPNPRPGRAPIGPAT